MDPDLLRKEIEILLRAGPEHWQQTAKSLSPGTQFLARPNSVAAAGSFVIADYRSKCSPAPDGWPELAKFIHHAHDLLSVQRNSAEQWKTGLDPDIIDAFPAVEVFLAIAEEEPAGWREKWQRAGGGIIEGRCVSLKMAGVLQRFGDYGQPFEPFDWTGALSEKDVDRGDAEGLGLL